MRRDSKMVFFVVLTAKNDRVIGKHICYSFKLYNVLFTWFFFLFLSAHLLSSYSFRIFRWGMLKNCLKKNKSGYAKQYLTCALNTGRGLIISQEFSVKERLGVRKRKMWEIEYKMVTTVFNEKKKEWEWRFEKFTNKNLRIFVPSCFLEWTTFFHVCLFSNKKQCDHWVTSKIKTNFQLAVLLFCLLQEEKWITLYLEEEMSFLDHHKNVIERNLNLQSKRGKFSLFYNDKKVDEQVRLDWQHIQQISSFLLLLFLLLWEKLIFRFSFLSL